MLIIHPVTSETVQPHIGLPVVVVTHEGGRYYGILSGTANKQVILNDQPTASTAKTKSRKGKKARISSRRVPKKKARTRQHNQDQTEQPPAQYPAYHSLEAPVAHSEAHPLSERIAIEFSSIAYIVAII
jgi:hypothetical protein